MSNVEHLFENALVALELNRTKDQWLQANDLNINGFSNEVIEAIWELAIYTKYTYEPSLNAILIEWIKDYVGSGVSDDIFQRNRRFVLNMIEDWEKENEPQSRNS